MKDALLVAAVIALLAAGAYYATRRQVVIP